MEIPFLDLREQHQSIESEVFDAIHRVYEKTAFAGGPFVEEFEENFARFCGTKHAIGVGSGTDALWLVLLALGVKPGDEVITVPNTFIATVEAISLCGATPVFIDAEPVTYTMDPEKIELAITSRTKAIIPVHLYGQMADMDPIMAVAKRHNIPVLEDAAQAHGSDYQGKRAGSFGIAACYSFYPGKNLGACGEAGAIVTNDDNLADVVKKLRDHGQQKKYYHSIVGTNGRMDGIQGAVLNVKLKYIEEWNNQRIAHAALYHELLSGCEKVVLPKTAEGRTHIFHLFVVLNENRDSFIEELANKDVKCGIHYPISVHLQDAYKHLSYKKGDFPVAEMNADRCVSLPMFPELRREQVETVVKSII